MLLKKRIPVQKKSTGSDLKKSGLDIGFQDT